MKFFLQIYFLLQILNGETILHNWNIFYLVIELRTLNIPINPLSVWRPRSKYHRTSSIRCWCANSYLNCGKIKHFFWPFSSWTYDWLEKNVLWFFCINELPCVNMWICEYGERAFIACEAINNDLRQFFFVFCFVNIVQ